MNSPLRIGLVWIFISMFPAFVLGQRTSFVGSDYARIDSVQDVIQRWSPDQHLYVKGDLGVTQEKLNELQKWLSKEAPHWTVVLMNEAAGERFIAADGRAYTGFEAVNHALGKGLTNRTAFGQLENAATHETDGAIFALFLKERKFSYFASEAQTRRGLGSARWLGELDQPAFRAMRGGGRITDAVKDTVRSIDQRLDRMIKSEAEAAFNEQLERERDFQEAKESVAHLREVVAQIVTAKEEFNQEQKGATGALAQPPIQEWKEKLDRTQAGLSKSNAKESLQPLKQLGDELDSYLNGYAAYQGFENNRKDIEKDLVNLAAGPNQVAAAKVAEIRKILEQAERKRVNGDMELNDLFREADQKVTEGERLIDAEKKRIEDQKSRNRLIAQVASTVAAATAALTGFILWLFNRKRKPAMDRAHETLRQRAESVDKETDGIDQIFDKSTELLGSRERVKERGYTGLTRDLSIGALDDIDDLFIMTKELRRVISDARGLVEPKAMWDQLVNTFSASRFEECVRHLSGKPLTFTRATGIPRVVMDIVRQRAKDAGEEIPKDVPDEVVLTFDEIFEAIKSRRHRATSSLKTLEDSLSEVNDELDRCQSELQAIVDHEKTLSDATATDGLFHVPNDFDVLIPSVQKDLADAESLATLDAVSAMQGPVLLASRKLSEAKALGDSISSFRANELLEFLKLSKDLQALGYPTQWIEAELRQRSEWANRLFEQCSRESIEVGFGEWKLSMAQLLERAKEALRLAEHLKTETSPRIETLVTEISQARGDLSKQLKLPETKVLVEPQLNPDGALVQARRNLEAASTLLRQGKVEACQSAIQGCDAEVGKAVQWIESSKVSVKKFDSTLTKERSRLQETMERCHRLSGLLRDAERNYSGAALRLAYTSTEAPSPSWDAPSSESPITEYEKAEAVQEKLDSTQGNQTADIDTAASAIADEGVNLGSDRATQLLDRAEALAAQCRTIHDAAQSDFQRGYVLAAMQQVQDAGTLIAQMDRRLQRVEEHLQKLEKQVVDNQQILVTCVGAVQRLQDFERDRMVTMPTLQQIADVTNQLGQVQKQYSDRTSRTNPFEFAQLLLFFQKRIAELEGMVVSDRHGFAEASRAVDGAVRQWNVAKQFVQQSRTDNIPDSPATTEGIRRVDVLERSVLGVQRDIATDHGDWQDVVRRAAELQSDLASTSKQLSSELQSASQALQAFQVASESVYNAEHWTGPWGLRIKDSPGIRPLETARGQLQNGNYAAVLEFSRQAQQAAQIAIQRMEREVQARKLEEQQKAERQRRERIAAEASRSGTIIIGGFPGSNSGPSIFGNGGGFGGG
ncbi:MAG: hypothetical protein WCI02_18165, partial [Planctomycetota bacterium]